MNTVAPGFTEAEVAQRLIVRLAENAGTDEDGRAAEPHNHAEEVKKCAAQISAPRALARARSSAG